MPTATMVADVAGAAVGVPGIGTATDAVCKVGRAIYGFLKKLFGGDTDDWNVEHDRLTKNGWVRLDWIMKELLSNKVAQQVAFIELHGPNAIADGSTMYNEVIKPIDDFLDKTDKLLTWCFPELIAAKPHVLHDSTRFWFHKDHNYCAFQLGSSSLSYEKLMRPGFIRLKAYGDGRGDTDMTKANKECVVGFIRSGDGALFFQRRTNIDDYGSLKYPAEYFKDKTPLMYDPDTGKAIEGLKNWPLFKNAIIAAAAKHPASASTVIGVAGAEMLGGMDGNDDGGFMAIIKKLLIAIGKATGA